MAKEEIEARLKELEREETDLRRMLEDLENKVQDAPGSHRRGAPPPQVVETEREIRSVVLKLNDIDRRRQELTVASSLSG